MEYNCYIPFITIYNCKFSGMPMVIAPSKSPRRHVCVFRTAIYPVIKALSPAEKQEPHIVICPVRMGPPRYRSVEI